MEQGFSFYSFIIQANEKFSLILRLTSTLSVCFFLRSLSLWNPCIMWNKERLRRLLLLFFTSIRLHLQLGNDWKHRCVEFQKFKLISEYLHMNIGSRQLQKSQISQLGLKKCQWYLLIITVSGPSHGAPTAVSKSAPCWQIQLTEQIYTFFHQSVPSSLVQCLLGQQRVDFAWY